MRMLSSNFSVYSVEYIICVYQKICIAMIFTQYEIKACAATSHPARWPVQSCKPAAI